MATTDFEQLQGIRNLVRKYTGLSSTGDIADATVDILINDFYTNTFVKTIQAENFRLDFTQDVTATDDGEYSLAANVIEIDGYATFNNEYMTQYYNRDVFFSDYKDQETYNTAPGLAVGASDSKKVYTAAFNYRIADWTYSVASTETVLSGSTVPQNKYGAYYLKVDADGTIEATEASDNGTGYATPGRAINGLNTTTSDESVIGYVTVISTDAGGFVPGTTALDDAAVTDTYTDGDPAYRGRPDAFYVGGRKLFIKLKSDDQGLFKAKLLLKRPDDLSGDTDTVFNEEWGNAIAAGTAAAYLTQIDDRERAMKVTGTAQDIGTYRWYINSIDRDWILQEDQAPFMRSY